MNQPEQINEPGVLRHSRFCGQGVCSSHSLISATNQADMHSVSDGTKQLVTITVNLSVKSHDWKIL